MIRFLLFTTIILLAACGSDENPSDIHDTFWSNPPLSLDSLKSNQPLVNVLTGDIDSIPAEIQIVIHPDLTISGSYFYQQYQKLMPFKGRIFKDGRVNLAVYDIHLEEVEQFKGKIDEHWQFRGKWQKIEAGAEKSPFQFTPKSNTSNDQTLAGTYEYKTQSYTQTLAIRKVSAQQFEFQLVISSDFCTGAVENGIAYFHSQHDASFYGEEGCHINFEMDFDKNSTIKVGERDCMFYHGMRCTFDGAYQKSSAEVEWIDDFYATDEELDSLLGL